MLIKDIQSGVEVFTDKADDSHVHVEVDGKSYQHGAPSPDYPIEIHSLNDFDVVSSTEKLTEGQLQEYDYGVEYENVDKINLNLSEPLRSVGDVKDRLFRDSDGLWKIERNVGKVIFNGSENWRASAFYNNERTINFGVRNVIPSYQKNINSNRFTKVPLTTAGSAVEGINNTREPDFRISIDRVRLETENLNGFKTWLDKNPTTVIYEIENPTLETLDQELQDKLNTLKSFKGSNYIYTVQNIDNPHKEQLKPTLHATFIAVKEHTLEEYTFDLRNKSIYVGSQGIDRGYLGDKELYNTSPVDLTRHVGDPEYVIDFTGGTIDYIGKEGYSLDAFMTAPKGEPELTDEGLYFYEGRILQSAERHSPTSGVFEVTVSVDEGKFGGSLEAIMAIGDAWYSNRKRAIGYQENSISFFDRYSSTQIQSEKIEGNEITIVFEWDINSSSNNVLFVNGERIGGINLSRVSNIDSTLFIGTSNNNDEGTFILKNIKHYSTANKLTDEQVMESYLLQKN